MALMPDKSESDFVQAPDATQADRERIAADEAIRMFAAEEQMYRNPNGEKSRFMSKKNRQSLAARYAQFQRDLLAIKNRAADPRVSTLEAELEAAKQDIDRLQNIANGYVNGEEFSALLAENARLREALKFAQGRFLNINIALSTDRGKAVNEAIRIADNGEDCIKMLLQSISGERE